MTTEPMLDRRLRELMAELAAPGDQSAAIDNVLSVTRAVRPEPRWRALLKERPMRTNSIVIAGSPPLQFGLDLRRHRADRPARRDRRRRCPGAASAGPATRLRTRRQRRPCLCRVRRHRDDRRCRGQRHHHHDRTGRSTAGRCSRGTAPGSRSCARSPGRRSSWWPTPTGRESMPSRRSCMTRSTQSTGPRTAIVWWSSATSSATRPDMSISCLPPTAPDPPSRSTSVTSPPTGGPPGVPRLVTRSFSEPIPRVGDPAAALYAIAPEGGTVRPLMEPATPEPIAPRRSGTRLSPDGRWATF